MHARSITAWILLTAGLPSASLQNSSAADDAARQERLDLVEEARRLKDAEQWEAALEAIEIADEACLAGGFTQASVLLCSWRATCFRGLGELEWELDAFLEGLDRLDEPEVEREFATRNRPLFVLDSADCLLRLSRYEEARVRALRAVELADDAGVPDPTRGMARATLGVALMMTKHPMEAAESFRSALEVLPEEHQDAFDAAAGLGDALLILGDYEASLRVREQTLARLEDQQRLDPGVTARALRGMALALDRLGQPEEASAHLERARSILTRSGLGNTEPSAVVEGLLAVLLQRQGKALDASRHGERAVALMENLLGPEHPNLIPHLGAWARALADLGRQDGDEDLDQRARALFGRAVTLGRSSDSPLTYYALEVFGEYLLDSGDPGRAIEIYDEAAALVESYRKRALDFGNPELQARYFDWLRRYDPYRGRARAWLQRGGVEEAVRSLEAGRSRSLLDIVAAANSDRPTEPTDLAEIRSSLSSGEVMAYYSIGEEESFVCMLPPSGEAALSFELRDTAGAPLGRAALRSQVARYRSSILQAGGAGAARGILLDASNSREDSIQLGADLFRSLVPEPLWERLRETSTLYIVPQGALCLLPFEALVLEPGRSHSDTLYWLDAGPDIAYTASGSIFDWSRARRDEQMEGDPASEAIVLADPDFLSARADESGSDLEVGADRPGGARPELGSDSKAGLRAGLSGLVRLPGARREGAAVDEALRGETAGVGRIHLLEGEGATERLLFQLAPAARFIHIAAHQIEATAGEVAGRIVLAEPMLERDGDGGEDGFLSLEDLIHGWARRLDRCELVVLSACGSALGLQVGDEGLLALPWGFQVAGCPSVVASLWPVSDEATATLMADVYRGVTARSAESRLRQFSLARKKLRKSRPEPFFWAPFVWNGAIR